MRRKQDTKYLERMNGGKWRVVVVVPKGLRDQFGKAALKVSLGTDSLTEANERKGPVVSDLKRRIAEAAGLSPVEDVAQMGIAVQAKLRAASELEDAEGLSERDAIEAEIYDIAEALRGAPVAVDRQGRPQYDRRREQQASVFAEIAHSRKTPLRAHEEDFRLQHHWEPKTWGKFDKIMGDLEAWLIAQHGSAMLEDITPRAASGFIGDISGKKGWAATTTNGYISSLQAYWRWLGKRHIIFNNPWQDQRMAKPRKKEKERERPFTEGEMRRLLYEGQPPAYIADLMRVAALTGARLGAILELTVGACQGGVFTIPAQKRESEAREVPIHSALAGIIARRTEGKPADAWLFPEVPPLPPTASPNAKRANLATKAFARYAEALGVREKRSGKRRSLINFHSFRRWFVTEAERAYASGAALGFTMATISEVVGHAVGGTTFGVYRGRSGLDQRRACAEAVKLPPPR